MVQQFGPYNFSHISAIQPVMDELGVICSFRPQVEYLKRPELSLHEHGGGTFCRFRIPNHLRHEGVYALTVGGEVQYIGECINLSSRYNAGYGQISPRNCYQGGQSTNCRINALIFQAALNGRNVELWFYQTNHRKPIEAELIRLLRPQWNRKG
jgi:hypothetical protein